MQAGTMAITMVPAAGAVKPPQYPNQPSLAANSRSDQNPGNTEPLNSVWMNLRTSSEW